MGLVLECNALSKTYSSNKGLKNLDLKLEGGKIIGLLGPNGSGKTTLIKLINGLLVPTSGNIMICDHKPSVESKKVISYLPERTYLPDWMRVKDALSYFQDFYEDFDIVRAEHMLQTLSVSKKDTLKSMSKGTKEKVQLILVMSRRAKLYCLDEPIAGVDPAARDYILSTILSNYEEDATILISTHLISDIENILDDVIFIKDGELCLYSSVEDIREKQHKSVDTLFREVFKCSANY